MRLCSASNVPRARSGLSPRRARSSARLLHADRLCPPAKVAFSFVSEREILDTFYNDQGATSKRLPYIFLSPIVSQLLSSIAFYIELASARQLSGGSSHCHAHQYTLNSIQCVLFSFPKVSDRHIKDLARWPCKSLSSLDSPTEFEQCFSHSTAASQ